MGETAMGWSDCGIDCNKDQYGTISRYIGPFALDGQFDFVLYHGVPYRVFAYDEKGLLHADYWTQQSQLQYPAGSVMTPFIGSHDSSRFVTLATYRGQPGYDKGVPGNQWNDLAGPPPDGEPYARHALALSWLMGLPGAPLLYYGDEYGEWGGADPGNRVFWRGEGTLSANESAVLDRARKLGQARRELVALRRGAYRSLHATETFLAFARETKDGKVAVVAVSREPGPTTTEITLPLTLPLPNGTALKDRLGGAGATITGGKLSISLPGRGAAILAP
jgi:glycosidase